MLFFTDVKTRLVSSRAVGYGRIAPIANQKAMDGEDILETPDE